MSNSKLVSYIQISPNAGNGNGRIRNNTIQGITIHHTAGVLSVEAIGNIFASASRQASSNYGIGSDGRIGMFVEECDRAWTSSNSKNDNKMITIEVSNSSVEGDWPVSDNVLSKLIELCVDICKRNNIKSLNYTGDVNGNLTRHNMFAATDCPGPYLQSKFNYIKDEVNKKLEIQLSTTPSTKKYNIGDKVKINGIYSNSNSTEVLKPDRTEGVITKVIDALNPYLLDNGDLGWSNDNVIVKKISDPVKTKKDINTIAEEVIKGLWGNGQDRFSRLSKAGYNANEIQNLVNAQLGVKANFNLKSNEVIANEVIKGLWGNGNERKEKLIRAGYNYDEIQNLVNKLI